MGPEKNKKCISKLDGTRASLKDLLKTCFSVIRLNVKCSEGLFLLLLHAESAAESAATEAAQPPSTLFALNY